MSAGTAAASGAQEPGKPAHRQARVLDLLAETMLDAPGLSRTGNLFICARPWTIAWFAPVALKRGWWVFECDGDGAIDDVELRLRSSQDGLLVFSKRRDAAAKVFFNTARTFDVSLLVSAWPRQVSLKTLRLRRLGRREAMRLAAAMVSRLIRSGKPLSRLLHVIANMRGGHALRVRSKPLSEAHNVSSEKEVFLAPSPPAAKANITVALREGESLHPRAPEIVSRTFAADDALQAVYADLAEDGFVRPRPDWDPDLAASVAYAPSPIFFRGERAVNDAWSMLRKLSETPGAVARIPLPLASTGKRAEAAYIIPPTPKLARTPSVSVIVPTKLRIDLLERCLASLANQTGYPDVEIVVVNNGADDPRFPAVIADASVRMNLKQIDDFGSFNFSRLINAGVKESKGEIVLILNDDVEAVEAGWLHRLVESAADPRVGCVGARLLYDDGTIQHAGVTLGISGICGHLWKGLDATQASAVPQVVLPSGRMAVTGACLALRRDVFDRAGGLDEESFPVAYNDIDLCLRIGALGFRTVYRGDAVLIHHESQSRGSDSETAAKRSRLARETTLFLQRWGHLLRDDPFGSPAYDPTTESGALHPALAVDAQGCAVVKDLS